MRIVLTADHAGVDLKDELAGWLRDQGHDVLDLGTHGHESVDYPRYGAMLADALAQYLDLEPIEKQALLEQDCLAGRAAGLVELIEMKMLMARTPGRSNVAH